MTLKDRYMPHHATAGSTLRPFVVCSVTTKRYTGSPGSTTKTPMQKVPPPTSINEQSSVPRGAATKQTHRSGSSSAIVAGAESRRASSSPMLNQATRVQKRSPLFPVTSEDQSRPRAAIAPKPLKIVQKSEEDELTDGRPAPVWSTQFTTESKPAPRPSCVRRGCLSWSSIDAATTCEVKQDAPVKASMVKALTARPRNPGLDFRKPFVDTITTKTTRHVKATGTSVRKPVVAGERRPGTRTRDLRLIPIAYPSAAWSPSPSPSPSPDPSSSSSRSWTIVVDLGVKQIKTPTTICGDETPSGISDASKSGIRGMPKDFCGPSKSVLSSAALSSPTVVSMPPSPAKCVADLDSTVEVGSPTRGPSAEVSPGTTPMATLTKVMDRSQVESLAGNENTGNSSRMTVRNAIEIARAFFSPSRRVSQSSTETAASKTTGTNVLRIRKLFVPPLEKGMKASKNPMTQMEIEMLRARRRVAGGGMVDPRLDRLGSLAAMAVVTKLGTSSPSQG